jgi:hypothetical protein
MRNVTDLRRVIRRLLLVAGAVVGGAQPALADPIVIADPPDPAVPLVIDRRDGLDQLVAADRIRLRRRVADICDTQEATGIPRDVGRVPAALSADAVVEPSPAAIHLPHPQLEYHPVAVQLGLRVWPPGPPGHYLLSVDVHTRELVRDLRVSLRLPAQVQLRALDRELSLVGELPEYIAVTPDLEYRDYVIGNAGPAGQPGTRRFRFVLSELPELGQVELKMQARSIDYRTAESSFDRLFFSNYRRANDRAAPLFTSAGLLESVLRAELQQACAEDNAELVYLTSSLLGDLQYGNATFDPSFTTTGPTGEDFCLEGQLEFSDVQGNRHPVPGARARLVLGGADAGDTKAQVDTSASGSFKFEFAASLIAGRGPANLLNLVFDAAGKHTDIYKTPAYVQAWSIGLLESAVVDLGAALLSGQCVDIGTLVADSAAHQENNYAFEVYSAIQLAGEVVAVAIPALAHLPVVYPSPPDDWLAQASSVFKADDGAGVASVIVAPLDPHNWDILHHEYGHYVQHLRNFPAPPGQPHNINQNHCTSKSKRQAIEFGWYEAWPTAMGMVVQKELPPGYGNVPLLADGSYSRGDLDGNLLFEEHFDPDSFQLPSMASESTEFVITAVLWDLYQKASFHTSYTPPPLSERILAPFPAWLISTGEITVTSFSRFNSTVVPGLAGFGPAPALDPRIGALLSRHRLGPMFVGQGNDAVIKLSSRWLFPMVNGPNCDAMTPAYPVHYFVRVFAADHKSVIWESEPSESAVVSVPLEELQTFLTGSGTTLHWHPGAVHPCEPPASPPLASESADEACDAAHASYPQTGPYLGAPWTMTDDHAICPPWLWAVLIALLLLLLALVVYLLVSGPALPATLLLVLVLLALAWFLYQYWYCLFS